MTQTLSQDDIASLKKLRAHFRDGGKKHRMMTPQKSGSPLPLVLAGSALLLLATAILPYTPYPYHPSALASFVEPHLVANILHYSVPTEKQIESILKKGADPATEARLAQWSEAVTFARNIPDPEAKAMIINWAANALFPYAHDKIAQERLSSIKEGAAWMELSFGAPGASWKKALTQTANNVVTKLRRDQSPQETLARGEGMCVDIAVLKTAALIDAGFNPKDVGVLFMKHQNGDHHAVAVFNKNGLKVLNNAQTKPARFLEAARIARPEYYDVLTQKNAFGGWTPYSLMVGNGEVMKVRETSALKKLAGGTLSSLPTIEAPAGEMSFMQLASYYIHARTEPTSPAALARGDLFSPYLTQKPAGTAALPATNATPRPG